MKQTHLLKTILVGVLIAFTISQAPGWSAAPVSAHGEITLLQKTVSWWSDAEETRGMHLARITDHEFTKRLFLLPSRGHRSILTSRLDARKGTLTSVLVDDVTGWWATLTIDYGVRSDSLNGFFRTGYAKLEDDTPQELRFKTSSGPGLTVQAVSADAPNYHAVLMDEMRAEHLVVYLANGIPEGLRGPILLLAGSLADVHSASETGLIGGKTHEPLLETLAQSLRETFEDSRENVVPMRLDDFVKGSELISEEARALIASFRAVDAANPLAPTPPEKIGE